MEEVIGGEKKSKTAFRLGVTIQYSWESLFSMMDSLVSKYQNYFSHHYLTQFHGFRSPLHANNLCPRLIYIHIHLPIKIFTWMSTQYLKQYIFKNKLRISNQPSAPSCNPQLHPANLQLPVSFLLRVAQNNLPFTHSVLPTKGSLMFFEQIKEHPHLKASVLTDVSTWDALCPEIHMTHLLSQSLLKCYFF